MTANLVSSRCIDTISSNQPKKEVRFDPCPKLHIIPNNLTPEEVEHIWWTRSETKATRRVCQQIAKESSKLCYLSECIDALYRTTSKMCCDSTTQESCLLETDVAKRFVRCSNNVATLRGLEGQMCKTSRVKSMSCRARICHMQRLPGMTEESLCRISQKYSRFDRILARLLGEADAMYQREHGRYNEKKRLREHPLTPTLSPKDHNDLAVMLQYHGMPTLNDLQLSEKQVEPRLSPFVSQHDNARRKQSSSPLSQA